MLLPAQTEMTSVLSLLLLAQRGRMLLTLLPA